VKPSERKRWSREELIVAFNLYCRTPFGKLHRSNPEIIQFAKLLDRTPSALAMKLVNFASLDPIHRARNVRGLSNISIADREVWEEFHSDWEELAARSQAAMENLTALKPSAHTPLPESMIETQRTETVGSARVRLVQGFFRAAVLAAYDAQCAICRLGLPELLVASHIIPWSKDARRRADPTNGLALCVLHDKAFDIGLISLDDSHRVLLSPRAKLESTSRLHIVGLHEAEGTPVAKPTRFQPDQAAIQYHRQNVFQN